MRSTAEWEAALDGTTEGKWIQAQGVEVWAEGDNGVNLYVGSAYQHNESREDNARLFVLAPEAVAEVVRLRRELEERIRVWQKVADKLEASGDTDVAEVMRHVGRSAARILNGGDDE